MTVTGVCCCYFQYNCNTNRHIQFHDAREHWKGRAQFCAGIDTAKGYLCISSEEMLNLRVESSPLPQELLFQHVNSSSYQIRPQQNSRVYIPSPWLYDQEESKVKD